MKYIYAFLGGALVGAAVALLYAPEKGDDLRAQIKEILRRNGLLKGQGDDIVIEEIAAELEAGK